ncbi:unnamed protein product [Clonostachys chloroleuca]|uniref:Uncharacterized protein n=1 Tax=Clonostachys chloroleuca TaxID=1926264 RepID=A0AA35MA07_9HYPO|nr:unnamed protein product [Clonostachys chloroleuca]
MVSVWFITGASNGLGLSLALYVLKSGHNVIAAMRNPTRSAEAAKSIEAAGGKIFQLDVTRPQDEIFKAIETAEAIYGRIDILVNNAGYSALGPAETFSEREIIRQFQTNVFGPIYLTQAALPGMRSRRSGTIVNLSSVAGQDGLPTCSLYAASKFSLEGFSEALSREISEFGISTLIIEPGAFRTNFLHAMEVDENSIPEVYQGTAVDQVLNKFKAAAGNQIGDPLKAAERMFEVIMGEGQGGSLKGKILRLVLGKDAYSRITAKIKKQQSDLEVAREVTFSTDL